MSDNPWPPASAEHDEWDRISTRLAAEFEEQRRMLDGTGLVQDAWPPQVDEDEHLQAARTLAAVGVLFGPDVSQYQGRPDWAKVKAAGCSLGIWKVSEGRTFLDGSAAYNRDAVVAAGLVPGCYHYLYFGQEYVTDPSLWAAQARWFVANAPRDAMHLLDVEAPATAGNHLGVREWVGEYRRLLPGHPLGVYTNRSLWQNRSRVPYDPGPDLFDFAWHAGVGNGYYTTATGTIPQQWAAQGSLSNSLAGVGWPEVSLWQITDHAAVPGVTASFCDGNAFQGTVAELRTYITGTNTEDPLTPDDITAIVTALRPVIKDTVNERVRSYFADPWAHVPAFAVANGGSAKPVTEKNPDGTTWTSYREPVLSMLQDLFRALGVVRTLAADDPSVAQISAAFAAQAPGIAASVTDGLKAALPATLDVDYGHVQQVVAAALHEHLRTLRIVSDAPASSEPPTGD